MIAAVDSGAKICRDTFVIEVVQRSDLSRINHEFRMVLDFPFDQFLMDTGQRMRVSKKVSC